MAAFLTGISVLSTAWIDGGMRIAARSETVQDLPQRLRIAAVDIDAAIVPVEETLRGNMASPRDPDDVGWYAKGALPGEEGTAILAGHYNTWRGKKGAFWDLPRVERGATIEIEMEQGASLSYVVEDIRSVSPDTDALLNLLPSSEGSFILLITCQGAWDPIKGGYADRLVVRGKWKQSSAMLSFPSSLSRGERIGGSMAGAGRP